MIKKSSLFRILTLALTLSTLPLFGAATTWGGGTSTDWSVAANWSTGSVPTNTDEAIFDVAGITNNIPSLTAAGFCDSFTTTTTFTLGGTSALSVSSAAADSNFTLAADNGLTITPPVVFSGSANEINFTGAVGATRTVTFSSAVSQLAGSATMNVGAATIVVVVDFRDTVDLTNGAPTPIAIADGSTLQISGQTFTSGDITSEAGGAVLFNTSTGTATYATAIQGAGDIFVSGAAPKIFSQPIGGVVPVGNLTINGTQSGTVTFNDDYTSAVGGTLTAATGVEEVTFGGAATIPGLVATVAGTDVTFSGTTEIGSVTNTGTVSFDSASTTTGTITNTSPGIVNFGATAVTLIDSAIDGTGIINVTGTGAYTFSGVIGAVPIGNISLAGNTGGTTFSGSVTLAGASTITVPVTTSLTLSNATVVAGGGIINSGTVNFTQTGGAAGYTIPITLNGDINITSDTGGTKTFSGAMGTVGTSVGTLTIVAGDNGDVDLNGVIFATDFVNNSEGVVQLLQNATITGVASTANNSDLHIDGAVFDVTATAAGLTTGTNSTIDFGTNTGPAAYTGDIIGPATINITGGGSKVFSAGTLGLTNPVGAITKDANASTTVFAAVNAQSFTNSVGSGLVTLGGAGAFTGTVTNVSAAGIEIGDALSASGLVNNGAGALNFTSAGAQTYAGGMEITGVGPITFSGANTGNTTTFGGLVGTVGVPAGLISVTQTGPVVFSGNVEGTTFTNAAASEGTTFQGNAHFTGDVTNNGSIDIEGATTFITDTSIIANTVGAIINFVGVGTPIHNAPITAAVAGNGVINVNGAGLVTLGGTIGTGPIFGAINVNAGNTGGTVFAGVNATSLTISEGAGPVTYTGPSNFTGTCAIPNGGVANIGGSTFTATGVTIAGTGQLNLTSATPAAYTFPITTAGVSTGNVDVAGAGLIQLGAIGGGYQGVNPLNVISVAATNTGGTTFNDVVNATTFTIANATAGTTTFQGDASFTGSVTLGTGTTVDIASNQFSASQITAPGGATLLGFSATTGTPAYATPIDGAVPITLSGAGAKTFTGVIGGVTRVGAITVAASSTAINTFGANVSAGPLTNNPANGQTVFSAIANFAGNVTVANTSRVVFNGPSFFSTGLTNNATTSGYVEFGSITGATTIGGPINGSGAYKITGAGTKTFLDLVGAGPSIGNLTVGASSGDVTFNSAVVGAGGLTLDGAGTATTTFKAAADFGVSAISIGNGMTLNVESTLTATALIDNAGTLGFTALAAGGDQPYTNNIDDIGLVNVAGTANKTFSGTFGFNNAGSFNVSNTGTTTFTSATFNGTTFDSTGGSGNITFAAAAGPIFTGAVNFGNFTNINSAFAVATPNGITNTGTLNFGSQTTASYGMTIDGGGTINILDGGAGAITNTFTNDIGSLNTGVGAITIAATTNANPTIFSGDVTGASFTTQVNAGGLITFSGTTVFTGAATMTTDDSTLTISGPSFTAGNGTANSGILGGATSGQLTFATATGDATYNTAIDGALPMTISGASTSKTFQQKIGSGTVIGAITVDASNTGTLTFSDTVTAASFSNVAGSGATTFAATTVFANTVTNTDTLTFSGGLTSGAVTSTGTLLFNSPATQLYEMVIGGVGALSVDSGAATTLKTFSGLIGTGATPLGAITLAGTNVGDLTFSNTLFAASFANASGAGETTFSGVTTLGAGVTIQGTTVVNVNNAFNSGTITNNGTLNFAAPTGGPYTYTQDINNPPALALGGALVDGDLNINGLTAKTYTGNLLGTGTINIANVSATGTTLFSGTLSGDKTINIAVGGNACGDTTFDNAFVDDTIVNVGATAGITLFTGALGGGGSMSIAAGTSVVTLAADASYTGDTTIGAAAALNIGGSFASKITALAGTATFTAINTESITQSITYTANTGVLATSGAGTKNIHGEINGAFQSAQFNVGGTGRVTLNSTSTFSGDTNIATGATLIVRNDYLSAIALVDNASNLTFNPVADLPDRHLEVAGGISGGGLGGAGVVTIQDTDDTGEHVWFTQNHTYTTPTSIDGGYLEVQSAFASPVSFTGNGGTIDFDSKVTSPTPNPIYTTLVSINTTNGAMVVSDAGTKTFQGLIEGTGPVNLSSTALLTVFSGTDKTYSGTTTIGAGTKLEVQTGLGTTPIAMGAQGSELIFNLTGAQNYGGVITTGPQTLPILIQGTGTQTFSANQTYNSVGTSVTESATLKLENAFASDLTLTSDATNALNFASQGTPTYDLGISGAGPGGVLFSDGGTSTITGDASYTGDTTLLGTANATFTGAFASNVVDLQVNSTLTFNRTATPLAYSGAITGAGALTISGTVDQTFTGVNAVGALTIGAGSNLIIGGSGTLAFTQATNSGTLTFSSSATQEVTSTITGSGAVVVTTGTVNYTPAQTYLGVTTVQTGAILNAANSIQNSAVTVDAGGTLNCTTAGSPPTFGSLVNNGTVSGASVVGTTGGLTVNGNYTQNAGATLALGITPTENGNAKLHVIGAATIDGTLQVDVGNGTYTKGQKFVVVTASTMTPSSNFSSYTENVEHAYNFSTAKEGDTIVLTVIDPIIQLPVVLSALGGNLSGIVDYYYQEVIPNIALVDSEEDLEVVANVAASELDATQFSNAMMMLSPLTQASMPNNAMQSTSQMASLFNKKYLAVSKHSRARNDAGKQMLTYGTPETSFFVEPVGIFVNQKANGTIFVDGQQPYTSQTYGVGAGAIKVYNGEFILEGAVGYTNSNLNWKENFGNSQWSTLYIAPFIGFFRDRYYANAMIMGAFNFYNTSRGIHFASINRTAKSRYVSYDLLLRFCVGGRLPLGNTVWFQPDAVLNYLGTLVSSYTEKGASQLNLIVRQQTDNQLQPSFRARLIKEYYTKKCTFSPNIYVGWLANIPLGSATITSRFQGAPTKQFFNIVGQPNTTNQLIVGGEYTMKAGDTFNLTATFEADFLSRFEVYTGKVKLEWLF